MNKTNIESFGLSKIKKQKSGGLSISYSALYKEGDQIKLKEVNTKDDTIPDDDFLNDLNSLKEFVFKVINYGLIRDLVMDSKFNATDSQKTIVSTLTASLMNNIFITGIKVWGIGDDLKACQIEYSLTGYNSQKIDLKTYKISISSKESFIHGFEDDLLEVITSLIKHSYEYVFENKGGQAALFEAE